MEKLREIEAYLIKEHKNLSKSKYRPRTSNNIEQKRNSLQENFTNYRKVLKSLEGVLKPSAWNKEVELYSTIKSLYASCITILNNSKVIEIENNNQAENDGDTESETFLANEKSPRIEPIIEDSLLRVNSDINLIKRIFRFKILAKIVVWLQRKMALDIKTAAELATLIPSYDGNPGGVKSFVDAVNLAKTIVPAANKAAAIQVILTKLSGKGRNLFTETPTEYEQIITKIQQNCGEKGNSDLALTNLKNLKNKSTDDIQTFTKQIDTLTEKLAEAYIREQLPNDVARKMAQKSAIQTLINNSTNSETRMMLKIGKFDNLQEAINVMVENEQSTNKNMNAVVLQATRNNRQQFNNRNNNRFTNQGPTNRMAPMNESTVRRFQPRTNVQGTFQHRYPNPNPNRNFNNNQQYNNRNFYHNNNRNYVSDRNFNRYNNPARMYFASQQGIPQPNHQNNQNSVQVVANDNHNRFNNLVTQNPINNYQPPLPTNESNNPNYFLVRQ